MLFLTFFAFVYRCFTYWQYFCLRIFQFLSHYPPLTHHSINPIVLVVFKKDSVKLTFTSEYALLALVFLARHKSDGFINVREIAKAQSIPPRFLEQILRMLKLSNYVQSLKGKNGGFRLARPPESITLAEIVRLFDGALAPTKSASKYFHEKTPVAKEKKLLHLFQEIRDFIADKMEHTTLADV